MANVLRKLRVDFASLVDAGANQSATIELFKRADDAEQIEKMIREEGGRFCVYSQDGSERIACHDTREAAIAQLRAIEARKRDFSQEQRDAMAERGTAMPDGSYPIATATDLRNAIQAIGRAKDRAAVMAHIKRRAKALGMTDQLPESWMTKRDDMEDQHMADKKADPKAADSPTVETLTAQVAELTAELGKRDEQIAALQKAAETPPTDEDVLKAMPESVRKRIEDAEAKAKAAEDIAKAERDLRETSEWIAKARGYARLAIKAEDFGPVLKSAAAALPPAQFAELERVLKAADAGLAQLFTEVGRSGDGEVDASPSARIDKLASQMVADKTAATYGEAIAKIGKMPEHRALLEQFQTERN